MVFEIKNKVALVTGAASGIGFEYIKELFRNGLRAVTIADINENFGSKALKTIEQEFGGGKAIFLKVDVMNKNELEGAFKKCVETFKNLDILINNAGILNDAIWEKEIQINIVGTIYGFNLAYEKYLNYRTNPNGEACIVNISSIAGVKGYGLVPIYTATKFAVHGFTLSWGKKKFYDKTKIKVIALCPGVTETPLLKDLENKVCNPICIDLMDEVETSPIQTSSQCAKAMMEVIKNATTGTIWIAEGGNPPYEFKMPDRESFRL